MRWVSFEAVPRPRRLRNQLLSELSLGEIAADSARRSGRIERPDPQGAQVKPPLQCINELGEPPDLGRGGACSIKIANEADADAVGIDGPDAGRRGGGLLPIPALSDLQFPVHATI